MQKTNLATLAVARQLLNSYRMHSRHPRSLHFGLSLVLVSSLAGCALDSVNDPGPGGGSGDDDPAPVVDGFARIASPDPEVDERLDLLGIACETTFTINGTFEPAAAPPADYEGCWPAGTWRVTYQTAFVGCDPQPEIAEEWVYEVTQDEDFQRTITYVADPEVQRINFAISTEATGTCHGELTHFLDNNHVISFKPLLAKGSNALTGTGTYSVYTYDAY